MHALGLAETSDIDNLGGSATPRSTKLFVAACLTTAVLVCAFLYWTLVSLGGAKATLWFDDLGEMVAAWIGAAACAVAALRHAGRGRAAWALMAASAFTWGAGEAVWSWYELRLGQQVPFPSLADAGFLGAVPLAAAAALLFPGVPRRQAARFASLLDGLIIASGLLVLSWATVLRAVYQAGGDSTFAQVLSIAYPAGDVVVATVLLALVMRLPRGNRVPIGLLVAGLGCSAIADSSFAYLTANGTYGSGNFLDTGWFAGYLLLALGAFRAAQRPVRLTDHHEVPPRWRVFLPYLPMAAALVAGGRGVILTGSLEPLLFWMTVALVGLVAARQALTVLDNHALVRDLGATAAEMRHRAFHDPLTGLPNRALFLGRVDSALERPAGAVALGHWLAVMVIDLDDFKDVNDSLGHGAGDRVLVSVAQRLRACVRANDTPARLGGDEFAVLLDGIESPATAEEIAARVVVALCYSDAEIGPRSVTVKASIGVAATRAGEASREELVRRADVAMYRAKGEGKGRFVIHDSAMDRHEKELGASA
ncbi:MAG TPA: GGDEF domain-containing protein [Candidatus Dormibacteraeota bacterium]